MTRDKSFQRLGTRDMGPIKDTHVPDQSNMMTL